MTVVAEPVVSGWLNKSFVKQLIDLRPLFWASLLDLGRKPFSICKTICVYWTVSNEALRAVPNTSILWFGFGTAPRRAGFLTEVMQMFPGGSWPYPGTRHRAVYLHSSFLHAVSSCPLEFGCPCHTSLNLPRGPFCQQSIAFMMPSGPFSTPFPGSKTVCPCQWFLPIRSCLPPFSQGMNMLLAQILSLPLPFFFFPPVVSTQYSNFLAFSLSL